MNELDKPKYLSFADAVKRNDIGIDKLRSWLDARIISNYGPQDDPKIEVRELDYYLNQEKKIVQAFNFLRKNGYRLEHEIMDAAQLLEEIAIFLRHFAALYAEIDDERQAKDMKYFGTFQMQAGFGLPVRTRRLFLNFMVGKELEKIGDKYRPLGPQKIGGKSHEVDE